MLNIRDSDFWGVLNIEPNAIIIDLHDCQSKYDFIGTITDTLHGETSYYPKRPPFSNLDGMNDYVGDFFIETWGEVRDIYILGWQYLIDFDPVLACKISITLHSAFLAAIGNQCLNHNGVGILEEVRNNVRMIAILN